MKNEVLITHLNNILNNYGYLIKAEWSTNDKDINVIVVQETSGTRQVFYGDIDPLYNYFNIEIFGDNIEHEFFEVESSNLMLYWERILIYHHKTTDRKYGYNKSGGGEGINGFYLSDETKLKISNTLTGRKRQPFSDEHKMKIADALTGRKRQPLSNEIKTKISLGGKGLKRSEQTKINIGNAIRGLKRSEESRKRISEAKKLYWANKRKNTI